MAAALPLQLVHADDWVGCYIVGNDDVAFIEVVREGAAYAFRAPGDASAHIPARVDGGRLHASLTAGGDFNSMVLERAGDGFRIVIDGDGLDLRRDACP